MTGVGDNIGSMLEDKYAKANLADVTRQADAPIEEALALMVREKLTGRPVPKSGRRSSISGASGSRTRPAQTSTSGPTSSNDQAFARARARHAGVDGDGRGTGDDQQQDDPSSDDDQPQGEDQSETAARTIRRDRRRRGALRRGGARPAARLLDKQLANLQGVVGRLANRCSAA
jgi:cobaltochelatase CobT